MSQIVKCFERCVSVVSRKLIWSFQYSGQQLSIEGQTTLMKTSFFLWLSFHFCIYPPNQFSHRFDDFGGMCGFGLVWFGHSLLFEISSNEIKNLKFLMTLIPVDITSHRLHSFVFNFIHIQSPIAKNQSCRLFLPLPLDSMLRI